MKTTIDTQGVTNIGGEAGLEVNGYLNVNGPIRVHGIEVDLLALFRKLGVLPTPPEVSKAPVVVAAAKVEEPAPAGVEEVVAGPAPVAAEDLTEDQATDTDESEEPSESGEDLPAIDAVAEDGSIATVTTKPAKKARFGKK